MTTVHASTPPVKASAVKGAKSPHVHLVLHGKDGKTVELDALLADVLNAVRDSGGVAVFELQVDKQDDTTVIVQSVEKDGTAISKMELREVSKNDFIRVDVEVAAKGLPAKAEAVRLQKRIKVRAKIKDIPKRIEVDLSELSPKETLCASDVSLPKGVELLSPKDAALFTVKTVAKV